MIDSLATDLLKEITCCRVEKSSVQLLQ